MTFLNKHKKVAGHENGVRTGLSNLSYEEQAKIPTFASQGEVKESELPQVSSPGAPFEESEYWVMPPSGIDWGFDSPALFDYPVSPNSLWNIVFQAWSDECYDKGESTDIEIRGTYPITGVAVCEPSNVSIAGGGNNYTITAPEEGPGYASIDVSMLTPNGIDAVPGGVSGVSRAVVWACTDSCEPDPAMAWDDAESAETVARNASVTVAVTGNNGPFTWGVSGTGFTLDNVVTAGLTNTLNADASACGTATITVTGCDSEVVVDYVRCTTGSWSAEIDNPAYSGCRGDAFCSVKCSVMDGKYWYRDFQGCTSTASEKDNCGNDCFEGQCSSNPCDCVDNWGNPSHCFRYAGFKFREWGC